MSISPAYTQMHLTEEEEAKLHCFQNTLDAKTQQRFKFLRRRLEQEQLTSDEHQELMKLTEEIENVNLARMEFLAEVARSYNISLADIVRLLNIHPLLS